MTARKLLMLIVTLCSISSCASTNKPDLSGMSFSDQPLLGKIVWHDLITEDLDTAKGFYANLFGWTLEKSRSPDGGDYILAKLGQTYVAGMVGVKRRADGEKVSRWLPYVSVANVDQAASQTTSAGGRVVMSPRDVNIGRVAAITDPQGAVLGLARSAVGDPDDRTTAGSAGKVVWTELLAGDRAAAAQFYKRVVGYEIRDIQRRGGDYTLLQSDGRDRAGIFANPMRSWNPVWLTFFGVADPATAAAKAESLGGHIVLAPSQELREGTIAVITDPAGAVLVLQKWPQ